MMKHLTFPNVPMRRVHWHWTAGGYFPNHLERRTYHFLIDGDGNVHQGVDVSLNSGRLKPGYAAHTRAANTDAIGVALCGMMGARQRPLHFGSAPLKAIQITSLVKLVKTLCDIYKIPVSRRTTLGHDEVQANLTIAQAGKWDISVLHFLPHLTQPGAVGDYIREQVGEVTMTLGPPVYSDPNPPVPAAGTGVVRVPRLNVRSGPGLDHQVTTVLLRDQVVQVVGFKETDMEWLNIITPGGFNAWVARRFVDIIDGPRVENPTIPS